ncbi:hypothetical protein ARMSODRAFT_21695 [Armillaria solidipes]|uniref:Uncharacterized protein n=1 Tax=Armillaria solidipes TaxID=1076256 RepID=A0A2H3C4R8_9AGAR|nr:hypothetical protein ARMSODRAFT_21695 [Armillaria solidipes]
MTLHIQLLYVSYLSFLCHTLMAGAPVLTCSYLLHRASADNRFWKYEPCDSKSESMNLYESS